MHHSLIALSLTLHSIPYQTTNKCCFIHQHFKHTGLVDMLLGDATDTVVHWVNVRATGDINCDFGFTC